MATVPPPFILKGAKPKLLAEKLTHVWPVAQAVPVDSAVWVPVPTTVLKLCDTSANLLAATDTLTVAAVAVTTSVACVAFHLHTATRLSGALANQELFLFC